MPAPSPKVEMGFFDWREAVDAGGNYRSAEIPYFIFNVESEDAALAACLASANPRFGRLFLDEVSIEERINASTFKATALYRVDESKERESGDTGGTGNANPQESFDTTGGTRHLNKSLSTISKTPAGAMDYGGAIEVDGDGNVNGVDVTMPVMTFSETHFFKPSKITTEYKKKVFLLTGKVNKAVFKGFAIGEVLFLGASGRRTGTSADDLWEITYKFAVSPSMSNIEVADGLSVTQKAGWDYMWVKFGEKVINGAITKTPVAAYVERVYEAGDFSDLNFPKSGTDTQGGKTA